MIARFHPAVRVGRLGEGKVESITGFSLPSATNGQTLRAISSATSDLNATERGRSVEPVRVSRRIITLAMLISAAAPRWTAIET